MYKYKECYKYVNVPKVKKKFDKIVLSVLNFSKRTIKIYQTKNSVRKKNNKINLNMNVQTRLQKLIAVVF